jgi:hypothetical protein
MIQLLVGAKVGKALNQGRLQRDFCVALEPRFARGFFWLVA